MYLSTIICKFNVNWTWWFDLLLRTIHLYSDCNTWPPTYSLNKYLVFKNFNILSFALKTEIKEKEKEYEKTTSALKLFTDRLLHWNFIVHKQKVFVFCKFLPKLWEKPNSTFWNLPSKKHVEVSVAFTKTQDPNYHHVATKSDYSNDEYHHTLQPVSCVFPKIIVLINTLVAFHCTVGKYRFVTYWDAKSCSLLR